MNGRIYDSKLGQFLQADPYIQEPTNTQSLNRYSYTLNNPLAYTDPSGFFFSDLVNAIFDIAKIVVAVVVGVVGQYWSCAAYIIGTLSFVQALGNGVSFGDAILAGVSSAALTYFGGQYAPGGFDWGYTLGMGTLGGITSVLQGGKFGHGFLSAGVGTASGGLKFGGMPTAQLTKRILTSAVIGGTLSKVTGGKFANGAVTAAFAFAVSAIANSPNFDNPDGTGTDSTGSITPDGTTTKGNLTIKYGSGLDKLEIAVEEYDTLSLFDDLTTDKARTINVSIDNSIDAFMEVPNSST